MLRCAIIYMYRLRIVLDLFRTFELEPKNIEKLNPNQRKGEIIMKRTMSNETRATRAIKMIYNAMATWEDVAEVLKISVSHCRKIVREHYKSKTAYNIRHAKMQDLKRRLTN